LNKKRVYVAKSKIHGTGVFTSGNFTKGELVLEIDDSDVVPDRSKLTPGQEIHIDVFIDKNGREKFTFMKSPEKYINTSCDPNVYSKTDMKSGIRRAYAFRGINKGEEITWDYAINSWEEWKIPADCNCGSPNCRKIIRGNFFSLPRDVQLKYIPLLDEPFKQRFKHEISLLRAK